MDFWTIEVADGDRLPASAWKDAHGEHLVEAALTHGAKDWSWVIRPWGVLLEVGFESEGQWQRFRATAAVQAALDGAPDPVNGVLVYSGRGGSSGAPAPRRPRPMPLSGSAAAPLPDVSAFEGLAYARPGMRDIELDPRADSLAG